MQTWSIQVDFSPHIKLGSCCTGLLLSSHHNGSSSGGKRAKLGRGSGRELCGYLHLPLPTAILTHCHCFTVAFRFTDLYRIRLEQSRFFLLLLDSKTFLTSFRESLIFESIIHFPHLSVKPVLINGGICPGGKLQVSVCTKSFKDWKPVCCPGWKGFMQSKQGGPPGQESGCD